MLHPGQIFDSPRGTHVVIREKSPERISFERTMPPGTGGDKRSRHRHTESHESFELLDGEATTTIEKQDRKLERGEVVEIPLGSAHSNPRSAEHAAATIVHSVVPCTRAVEVYFASWLHWLQEGKTADNDEPTTLQLAAITKEGGFGGTFVAGVPIVLQRLGLPVLGLIASLLGTHAVKVPAAPDVGRPAAD